MASHKENTSLLSINPDNSKKDYSSFKEDSSTVITYHNISYTVKVKVEGHKTNKLILKDLK